MQPKKTERPPAPKDIVRSGLCIGCGACAALADDSNVRMDLDRYGQYKPLGSTSWLDERSETFSRICPFSQFAENENSLAADQFPEAVSVHPATGRFLRAYVGHVAEDGFRAQGSSGGMVTWMLAELLRSGLIDAAAHVVPVSDPQSTRRFFKYRLSHTESEIRAGAKSQYYPIEMSGVLKSIRTNPGRYAVVGIPCFIKAVQLLRRTDPIFRERVAFTLGLFCGHMKSARFIESFAWQMNVSLADIQSIEFRHKDPSRPATTYTAQVTLKDGRIAQRDWWNMVDGDWGAGFFQNSACDFCDDVVGETADVSFGDAWVEPYSSDGRGTNVVVVRSPVVHRLVTAGLREGHLTLEPVDGEFIQQTQAAGLRQRREGLAYRLSWSRRGISPRKRLTQTARNLSVRRKLIYRTRSFISAWSHRMFFLSRLLGRPSLYLRWARIVYCVYEGCTYFRGPLGRILQRLRIT
jgi:coenzyme F420-reducing hydrogenase beta subunit